MRIGLYIIFTFFSLFVQSQNLKGFVVIEGSDNPIPFANLIWLNLGDGTVANAKGMFELSIQPQDTLMISAMGFQEKLILWDKIPSNGIIELSKSAHVLGDVKIKVKRKRRRKRKQDHAYLLHQAIANNRSSNDLQKKPYYTCEVYNKIEVDLNNVDSSTKSLLIFKPISFVFDHPDTSSLKKAFSPVFLSEGYSRYFFKRGNGEKELILASKNAGIEIPSVAKYSGSIYTDFNIYDSYIRIFQKQFISPLAKLSWLSYKYYITDSTLSGDTTFYRLDFRPRREQDLAFEGYLITDDKSKGVSEIQLNIPQKCNINYVEEFIINRKYAIKDSIWVLKHEFILIDVNPLQKSYGFYIQKNTSWNNYSFEIRKGETFFSSTQKTEVMDSAYEFGGELLKKYRPKKLDSLDQAIYLNIDSAMNTRYLKVLQNSSLMAYTGYYPLKYWEYGPYYSTYSFNSLEGRRLRLGFQTTQNIFQNWRFRGHIAHGLGDGITKYGGLITKYYGFKRWRYIEFEHLNDFKILSASDNAFKEDNILASLTRRVDPKFTHTLRTKLKWSHEWFNGINNFIELKTEKLIPIGNLTYITPNSEVIEGLNIHSIRLGGRLAIDEKFLRYGFRRVSLNTRNPRFDYAYTRGEKINGQGYEFQKVQIEMTDRYFFGYLGFLDVKLFAGKIWGDVPYPLLLNHRGNDSYYYDNEAFNLMNPFEFASDQQVSIMTKYNFNGLILNRLPLAKRMHLRSFVFANTVYGTLASGHESLIILPTGLSALNEPYFETGIGLDNIFKLLRLDFIWRLTNINSSKVQQFGVTFNILPSF